MSEPRDVVAIVDKAISVLNDWVGGPKIDCEADPQDVAEYAVGQLLAALAAHRAVVEENALLREFVSDVADGRWGVGSDWSDYAELYKRAIDSLVERAIALVDRIGDANKTKEAKDLDFFRGLIEEWKFKNG